MTILVVGGDVLGGDDLGDGDSGSNVLGGDVLGGYELGGDDLGGDDSGSDVLGDDVIIISDDEDNENCTDLSEFHQTEKTQIVTLTYKRKLNISMASKSLKILAVLCTVKSFS